MASLWKRLGLAAVIAAQLGIGPQFTWAQQPCGKHVPCGTTQPGPETPGRSHVSQPPEVSPSPTPDSPSPSDPVTPTPDPVEPLDPIPSPDPVEPLDSLEPPDSSGALAFGTAQGGLGSPDVAFSTPNMIGDLLNAYRSVQFQYNGGGDFSPILSAGATTIRNNKVAENNSAVPRTRFSFRYNYFHNANTVQGFERTSQTTEVSNFSEFAGNPQSQNVNIPLVAPKTESYDAHLYTFAFEKTFLEEMASLEVRIPFANTLDSTQNFIGAQPIPGTGAPAGVTQFLDNNLGFVPVNVPTGAAPLLGPGSDVLGQTDTELQDLTFILKMVLLQDTAGRSPFLVSGGLGFTAPTAQNVNVTVVDTYDDGQGFEPFVTDPSLAPPFNTAPLDVFNVGALGSATNFRRRDIEIENEIWSLSPFLAAVLTPTDRSFINGFAQVAIPLNSAEVRYRERRVDLVARDIFPNATGVNSAGLMFGPNGSEGDFRQTANLEEQTLLQLDIGGGYWLYRNRCAQYITGIASLLELHYTTSLDDADIVTFQSAPALLNSGLNSVEGPTQIGNLSNRIDILNLTVGGVLELSNTATLAVGYVTPLRDEFDRTFDGELNVQFNLYR